MSDQTLNTAVWGPIDLIDAVSAQLARVGLDLPPIWLQAAALLVSALFAWKLSQQVLLKKRGKTRPKPKPAAIVAFTALVLLTLGIGLGIVDNALLPSQVVGRVQFERLNEVRVALHGSSDTPISVGTDVVDSIDGRFALHYSPFRDGRARTLRITVAGCKHVDVGLFRPQLVSESLVERTFKCEQS